MFGFSLFIPIFKGRITNGVQANLSKPASDTGHLESLKVPWEHDQDVNSTGSLGVTKLYVISSTDKTWNLLPDHLCFIDDFLTIQTNCLRYSTFLELEGDLKSQVCMCVCVHVCAHIWILTGSVKMSYVLRSTPLEV